MLRANYTIVPGELLFLRLYDVVYVRDNSSQELKKYTPKEYLKLLAGASSQTAPATPDPARLSHTDSSSLTLEL